MPSLNYLDRSQDLYAIGGVGNAFNNAAMALQQNRMRQQEMAQRAALEGAYLSLAQQKNARENQLQAPILGQEQAKLAAEQRAMQVSQAVARLAAQRRAPNLMGIVQDPQSGSMMMNDLRSAGAIPQGPTQFTQEQLIQAINAALAGQLSGQAAMAPGTAEKMTEPVPVRSNEQLRDPFDLSQVLATGPAPQAAPLTPEEIAHLQAQTNEQKALAAEHEERTKQLRKPKPLTMTQALAKRVAEGKKTGETMPASKDLLVPGTVYQTSRGPAVWNGQAFEQ